MSEIADATDLQAPAGDDAVRPFAVPALDVRGRAVQIDATLNAILSRHDYPDEVSRLLGEAIVLTALLGSALKFDGRFILQTSTDGPVDLLVVDYRTNGGMRAYARFDEARIAAARAEGRTAPGELLGTGHMAMTVDQGKYMSRYQGVVPLAGDSLEEVAHTYFRQSEQIPTRVRLAVGEVRRRGEGDAGVSSGWRAGGVVVQYLPHASERAVQDLPGGDVPDHVDLPETHEDEAWTEARALTDTVEDVELIDPDVPVERLLFRLFNERGVQVFAPLAVHDECSCSRDKVAGILGGFTAEEIAESTENGVISVKCEFCGRAYEFDPAGFAPKDDG